MIEVLQLAKKAKQAAFELAGYTTKQKNEILKKIAEALLDKNNIVKIQRANAKDIQVARESGKDETFIDRLTITFDRLNQMTEGVNNIVALKDPVGEVVEKWDRPNGLKITRVRAPLGVIGIIYESRPNVTVDAAALCLKSGNAVILRGGKESLNSNRVLYKIMREAIVSVGLNENIISFIDDIDREVVRNLLQLDKYVDVVIPRGGEGLKSFIIENSKIPVIASAGGNCHTFVDKDADINKAIPIIVNAKCQRPSTCNALEHVIVHKDIAEEFIPIIYQALKIGKSVKVLVDDKAKAIVPKATLATKSDYATEFLSYKITICVVDDVKEAVDMINKYGTRHSEAILSNNKESIEYFKKNVDAAAVYVNTSTRFTDGFEFGLGAEMGISTQKLHARGPIGLKELTSVRYLIDGDGQLRK